MLDNIKNLKTFFSRHVYTWKSQKNKVNKLWDNYFNSIVLFFRLEGVPIQINKISTLYAIYMLTVISCISSIIIGFIIGVYYTATIWDT